MFMFMAFVFGMTVGWNLHKKKSTLLGFLTVRKKGENSNEK